MVTSAAFVVLAVLVGVEWSPLMDVDADAVGGAADISRDHSTYRDVMKSATWLLHSQLVLLYGAVLALGLVVARRPGAGIWLAVVVGVGTALNPVLKKVFDRERPTVAEPVETFRGLSFPSGHAASAGLICAAVAVVFWAASGRAGRPLLVMAVIGIPLLSGWTRVTLGGHYPSDVVAGTLWTVAWVAAWQPALPRLERAFSARASRPR